MHPAVPIFDVLMQTQHWQGEKLESYRRSQLEQLLQHACRTVPFYETRLDVLRGRDGSVDWGNWSQVPILTRGEVAGNFDQLISRHLPSNHGNTIEETTSGSTGIPIRVRSSALNGWAGVAADWRAQRWWNMDWSKTMVHWHGWSPEYERRGCNTNYGAWGNPNDPASAQGKLFVGDSTWSTAQKMSHLQAHGANYLGSQGNTTFAAGLDIKRQGLNFPLAGVLSWGVSVEPEFLAISRDVFGSQLHSIYSSKEGCRLAYSCGNCSHYHVCADMALFEILDANGNPCPEGVAGRIVITPFYNAAMPFIRYEQGDIGAWQTPAGCGNSLPALSIKLGRTYHSFVRRNGEIFAPQLQEAMIAELDAEFIQVAQVSASCIEIRYKPRETRDPAKEKAIADIVRKQFRDDYSLTFVEINSLPLTQSGKYLKYVNEFK